MEVTATFPGAPMPASFFRIVIAAVLAAFLLGGAGGYVMRGLTAATQSTSTVTTSPFVVEQAPNYSPRPSPVPEPTRDPKGFAVPV